MNARARLLAVAFSLLLPALALGAWSSLGRASERLPGLAGFPRAIGAWTLVEEGALSAEERAMLRPDSYLAWHFQAPERAPISVYVALYRGPSADGEGAHDPALCYPASGWEVMATRSVEIALPQGGRLSGKLLTAHQGTDERKALYWFQPAGRWPGSQGWEQVARIGDSLAGRSQFAFVRLSAPVEPGWDAEQDLIDFASEIGWPVRRALAPDS
jgi:EpsI family protein